MVFRGTVTKVTKIFFDMAKNFYLWKLYAKKEGIQRQTNETN